MKSTKFIIGLLLVALGAVVGMLALNVWKKDDPLEVGSMLAGFQRQNELSVFAADVVPVVVSQMKCGLLNRMTCKKTSIMPARVRYTVDMASVASDDIVWNAGSSTLEVTVPPIVVQQPSIDNARARHFTEGTWIGREVGDKLTTSNSIKAGREATKLARNAELMKLAQTSARDSVARNAEMFLRAAGVNATVIVRFANEGRPSSEQMDRSRRPEDVIANAS